MVIPQMTKVLIAIQARSSSSRLPNKAMEMIGNRRLLDHVIESCNRAANYSNKFAYKKNYTISLALLIPTGDPLKKIYSSQMEIIEGSEEDVLSRFVDAQRTYRADFICRITGDCPLIPPFTISKHISIAVYNKYDYISNVDEECRLSLDGVDCEVISSRLLRWIGDIATSPEEKEHVTLMARKSPPIWAKRAFTAGFFDQSGLKLSVDTKEDLERVRAQYDIVGKKLQIAERLYGRDSIHRF